MACTSNIWNKVSGGPIFASLVGLYVLGLVAVCLLTFSLNSPANELCHNDGGYQIITGDGHVLCQDFAAFSLKTGKFDPLGNSNITASEWRQGQKVAEQMEAGK